MKILYAVQATGNGHISRAIQLIPYLKQLGELDIFLSGSNSSLNIEYPIKFKSNGLSLYFDECGDLNILKSVRKSQYIRVYKEALALPVENYDLIINDFEHITAKACALKNVPSIQFGHQASFMSNKTPRPSRKSKIGEYVLANFAPASDYLGLHFDKYDDFISTPIIKERIINATPRDKGHITVYLPAFLRQCIKDTLQSLTDLQFHWFLDGIKEIKREGNIKYFPIDNHLFSLSMKDCHGIITGGGFETPSEALYLEKKLMVIPIRNHYEQQCNAAALKQMGIYVVENLYINNFSNHIRQWINEVKPEVTIVPNNIRSTLNKLLAIHKNMNVLHVI